MGWFSSLFGNRCPHCDASGYDDYFCVECSYPDICNVCSFPTNDYKNLCDQCAEEQSPDEENECE